MPNSLIIQKLAAIFIAGVWIFHGLYSKILNGIPRHKMIVERILGESVADIATIMIGTMEILLGCWVIWGKTPQDQRHDSDTRPDFDEHFGDYSRRRSSDFSCRHGCAESLFHHLDLVVGHPR